MRSRSATVATLAVVTVLAAILVIVNVLADEVTHGPITMPSPTATASASRGEREAARLATMAPDEIAAEGVEARPPVAPPGARDLADAAEEAARQQPFSFHVTTFNVLGSQHSAEGGAASEFAAGTTRIGWAVELLAAYGSDIVGFSELQSDQYAVLAAASPGFVFYPGTTLGQAGVPTNLMWRDDVWEATWQSHVTIPFMDGTRPMPVVRLRHRETGRETYVMNVHNSPRDRQGREVERDRAEAIEIAAVNALAEDGVPIVLMGDFNEHAEVFCRVTAQTTLVAASGGSQSGGSQAGGCRPPAVMRVDWIFGSRELEFDGFRIDTSPEVRRITDHAVLSTTVIVPAPAPAADRN